MTSNELSKLKNENNFISRIEKLERELETLKRRGVRAGNLAEIAPDLGTIRTGELYALASGVDPTDTDACGVFISSSGQTFLGIPWNLGGVNNGVLMFGLSSEDGRAYFAGGNGMIDVSGVHLSGLRYFLDWTAVNEGFTRVGYIQMKLQGTHPSPSFTIGQDTPEDVDLIANPYFQTSAEDWFGMVSIDDTGADRTYGEALSYPADSSTDDGYCVSLDGNENILIGGTFSVVDGNSYTRLAQYNIGAERGGAGYWYNPPPIYHPAVLLVAGHYETTSTWHPGYWDTETVPGSSVWVPGYYTYSSTWVDDQYSTAYYEYPAAVWVSGGLWSGFGSGLNGAVYGVAIDSTGKIYVVGAFTTANGVTVNGVAYWNGSTFVAMGSTGLKKSGVAATGYCIAIDEDDNVYVGGDFDQAGAETSVGNIAKWNGSAWSKLGNGVNNIVRGLYACPSTKNIMLVGDFTSVDGVAHSYYAKWNPSTPAFETYASDPAETKRCVYADSNETPVLANTDVERWDGSAWEVLGETDGTVNSIVLDSNDNIYSGGSFTDIEGVTVSNLAYYDNTTLEWYKIGDIDNTINGMCINSDDNLFIAKGDSAGSPDQGIIACRILTIKSSIEELTIEDDVQILERHFTGYYKFPTDNWNARFCLRFYDDSQEFIEDQEYFNVDALCDWTGFDETFIPPEDAKYVQVLIKMGMAPTEPDSNLVKDVLDHLTKMDSVRVYEKQNTEYQIYFQPFPMTKEGSTRERIMTCEHHNFNPRTDQDPVAILKDNGSIDAGTHSWKVTFYDQSGETLPTEKSNVLTMVDSDSYSKLLLHCDGADGSTTFTDESGKTVTPNGDVHIDDSESIFGNQSAYFDGTSDYLSVPDSDDWNLEDGANNTYWTIDFWIKWDGSVPTNQVFFSQYVNSSNCWDLRLNGINGLRFNLVTTGVTRNASAWAWSPSADTWYHVAIVKNGTSGYMAFINGIQIGSTYSSHSANVGNFAAALEIGILAGASYCVQGWMDEIRISKGIARWTSNFTPETGPYEATSQSAEITIPLGRLGIVGRRIYRTEAGDSGTWKYTGIVEDNTTTTFIDRLADANLGDDAPSENKTASRPKYPRQATVGANGAISNTTLSYTAGYWGFQTSAANANDGDWFEWDFWLSEGTFTVIFSGYVGTQNGKLDWYIDDTAIETGQDWYAASAAYTHKTKTGVSVSGNGYHVLRAKVNTKNGSSGDYRVFLHEITFKPETSH